MIMHQNVSIERNLNDQNETVTPFAGFWTLKLSFYARLAESGKKKFEWIFKFAGGEKGRKRNLKSPGEKKCKVSTR